MKKLIVILCAVFLLSSCAGLNKSAGYPKDTQKNTDWRTNKL